MWEHAGAFVAAAAFLVNIAVLLVGYGRASERQETRMQALKTEMQTMVTEAQTDLDGKIETTIQRFGENAIAIRQKITEVELFMRDNYIKRDSFYHGLNDLSESVKGLSTGLDARLIRMETKIDAARASQRDGGGT